MANLMHRFFKNKSCFNSIQRLTTTPSLFTYQKPFIINTNIESVTEKPDPVSFANPLITLSGNEFNQPMRFYPSFSMGLCLNPKMIQGLDLAETASLVEEEDAKEIVIYADSVKKKRKKKMNKHKYRKLRKQLGRKS
ncbi:hypothetical protein ISN45_Aa08g027370 [Arabidopsis thaliana x Arabidopsis arenosa]|uniref:Small ribosomal subunit protein mS38 n=1 Tax=Arabidopsis thaliana x Arabidopsis arenosa TaxID=1240361 RepID=A0A8T1XKY9_9BRAS|nr:hypothetical protein ISN45_Aa08g027370 [Arabidopsis thaliana x Arabidopsis arenosa]